MTNPYIPVSMDIGSNRKATINVRQDVVDYFKFSTETPTDLTVTRSRKAHTRTIYNGLNDTTASSTNVAASEWVAIKSTAKLGSGIPVRIPTKLKTNKGNIRMVTIRFPDVNPGEGAET